MRFSVGECTMYTKIRDGMSNLFSPDQENCSINLQKSFDSFDCIRDLIHLG